MNEILGNWFYTFIGYLVITMICALLLLILIYVILAYRNIMKAKRIEVKISYLNEMLNQYKNGQIGLNFWLDAARMKDEVLADLLVESKIDTKMQRELYLKMGFHKEDEKRLKSRKWYKKTKTLERWKRLGMLKQEQEVVKLLSHPHNEVRLAAVDLLSYHKHPALKENIEMLFGFYDGYVDDFLIVKLMNADIDVRDLEPLTRSPEIRLRRAGMILLGREGEKNAIPILERMEHVEMQINYEIVRSLGRIRCIEGVALLKHMSTNTSSKIREEVANSLGMIFQEKKEVEEAMPILEVLARDDIQAVRVAAFLALSKLGDLGREVIKRFREVYPEISREALLKSFSPRGSIS